MSYSYTVTVDPGRNEQYYDTILQQIIDVSADIFDVDPKRLYTKERTMDAKLCRWTIWQIMWGCYNYTLPKTSRIFGDHDHTTVLHALRELPGVLDKYPEMKNKYDEVLLKFNVDREKIIYRSRKYAVKSSYCAGENQLSERAYKFKMANYLKSKNA